MRLICAYCGCKTVDKNSDDYIQINGKNYHKICGERQKEKDSCINYLCLVLGLKAPGPRIYTQLKEYTTQRGYSYKGIEQTLYFIYEVLKKKDKFPVAKKTIGLVPYYYTEAQNYFNEIEYKKEQVEKEIKEAKANEQIVKSTLGSRKEKQLAYNLDDII